MKDAGSRREAGPGGAWRRWARRLVDGALLAVAAGLLVQRGGPLRDAIDGWLRQRTLLERSAARWSELTGLTPGGRAGGVRATSAVLVEFTDYRCPFCRRAQDALDSLDLLPIGPSDLGAPAEASVGRRVVRHLPIASLHPDAPLLARVSVCAEGDAAFPAVHRALYDAPSPASDAALIRLLVETAVDDPEAVLRCAGTPWASARVRDDLRLAAELRLRATPTFLARDAVHEGTLSVARLREMLRLTPPAVRERATKERPP